MKFRHPQTCTPELYCVSIPADPCLCPNIVGRRGFCTLFVIGRSSPRLRKSEELSYTADATLEKGPCFEEPHHSTVVIDSFVYYPACSSYLRFSSGAWRRLLRSEPQRSLLVRSPTRFTLLETLNIVHLHLARIQE